MQKRKERPFDIDNKIDDNDDNDDIDDNDDNDDINDIDDIDDDNDEYNEDDDMKRSSRKRAKYASSKSTTSSLLSSVSNSSNSSNSSNLSSVSNSSSFSSSSSSSCSSFKNDMLTIVNPVLLDSNDNDSCEIPASIWDQWMVAVERKHDGIATFFQAYCYDKIKVIDSQGNGYIWDDEKCLWIYYSTARFPRFIGKTLVNFLDTKLRNSVNMDCQKKINQMIGKYAGINFMSSVWRILYPDYYDEQFSVSMNEGIRDVLPIQNKLLIDLRTGETRLRTSDDYF